jgi:UDP-glucose 4-epimerase
VRVLDDLSTGKRANLPPQAELIVGDVADPVAVRDVIAGTDGCFHLAAVASVEKGNRDWLGTHRTNLTGAIAVFDAARTARPGSPPVPVVYASSAAVYGDPASVPIDETAPVRPLSAYGADKLGCELHARVGAVVHGVPSVGMRFFNVYGPRQDPSSPYSGVISIFCDRIKAGQPIKIFGDGKQTRDFVYVGDVVRALVAAMERRPAEPSVFNVCTGRETSVLDLARTVGDLCGVAPEIEWCPPRSGEIRTSLGSAAAMNRHLGVVAETLLPDGLRATLAALS